ncbi:MAG: hypothetical protein GX603_01815 [Chloroflexi bacterium]|nr:hypothetical protein [Chloroflexota bacterium]
MMEHYRSDSLTLFETPLPPRCFLAIGAHALSERMLQLISSLALRQHVTVLDCGNRSNMYAVAKLIRPYTSDPVSVMNNIRLSRAFTCYQVLAMIQATAKNPPREPLVLLDLLATFLDEDVELKDSQRLLTHSLSLLAEMSHFVPVMISTRQIPAIAENRSVLLEQLKASVDICWEEPLPLPTSQELQLALF